MFPLYNNLYCHRNNFDKKKHISSLVWLNQCVGELNYRYFLLFLLLHMIFFGYGSAVVYGVMMSDVYEREIFHGVFITSDGTELPATNYLVFGYVLRTEGTLFALFVFAFAFCIAIGLFLLYHLYLIATGQTTNESFKWKDVKAAWKRFHSRLKKQSAAATRVLSSPLSEKPIRKEEGNSEPTVCAEAIGFSEKEENIVSSIPQASVQNEGREATTDTSAEDYDSDEEEIDISSGQMPQNTYNKGFFANMRWRFLNRLPP